ncbi:hypothetical protein GCM10010123_12320 [Pilimelia anulata]|uniref:Histidine kinase/HSP90-like ATPase domain-containing protein n=1 Tax=Pilimelia anulata TaxID=53371 RepID=A0A8J3F885_9ACTN|nr:hypothetical protein GCM10010123_12320 [Pilimelia anulata]
MPGILRASWPPGGAVTLGSWPLDGPPALAAVRAGMRAALAALGWRDGSTAADVLLVATELATNALRHGLAPARALLLRAPAVLVFDVADSAPAQSPRVRDAVGTDGGGMGLRVAQRVALDVGWYTAGPHKHVWATFPTTPD